MTTDTDWGLGNPDTDPGQKLLELVAQSAARVELLSGLLEQAYHAAERLHRTHHAGQLLTTSPSENDDEEEEPADIQTARQDLDRILTTGGGAAALVGHTYSATSAGSVYATGEAIRGLAKLEAEERDRCANYAAKAVATGLVERQIQVTETQGRLMADLIRGVLEDPEIGLTDRQRELVPELAQRMLRSVP